MVGSFLLALLVVRMGWAPCLAKRFAGVESKLQSAETSRNLAGHAEICADSIVEDTCASLTGDDEAASIRAGDVQTLLSASRASVDMLWRKLRLSEEIPCKALCDSIAAFFADASDLPPVSDVACWRDSNGQHCDTELDPETIRNISRRSSADIPDFHDEDMLEPQNTQAMWEDIEEGFQDGKVMVKASEEIEYDPKDLARRIANLFRIHPSTSMSFSEAKGNESSLLEDGRGVVIDITLNRVGSKGSSFKVDYHRTPAVVKWIKTDSKVHRAGLRKGDKIIGVDGQQMPTSSHLRNVLSLKKVTVLTVMRGTGATFPTILDEEDKNWKAIAWKASLEAQAYVNTALARFNKRATKKPLQKWFGWQAYSDPDYRNEVQRILNSVANMLSNVEYIYPGEDCDFSTVAYVYPYGEDSKNENGQYLFYLCKRWMTSPLNEKIEALTHEGSHHATAFTDDMCADELHGGFYAEMKQESKAAFPKNVKVDTWYRMMYDGERLDTVVRLVTATHVHLQIDPPGDDCKHKAYGRQDCVRLASADPLKALRNADNFCYYVQDVTDDPDLEAKTAQIKAKARRLKDSKDKG